MILSLCLQIALIAPGAMHAQDVRTAVARAGAFAERLDPKVKVDPEVAGEVVVSRYSEEDARVVPEKLAFVLHATWDPVGRRIRRTREEQRALESASLEERIQRYRIALAKLGEVRTVQDAGEQANRVIAAYRQLQYDLANAIHDPSTGVFNPRLDLPTSDLMRQILVDLGAAHLAQLPIGKTTVLSSQPTAAQVPLKTDVKPWLSAFEETMRIVAEQFPDDLRSDRRLAPYVSALFEQVERAKSGAAKVNAFVLRRSDRVTLQVAVYSASGSIIAVEATTLRPEVKPAGVSLKVDEEAFARLSALTIEFNQIVPGRRPDTVVDSPIAHGVKPSERLHYGMLHPEEHDPLAYNVADALIGLAEHLDRRLMACVCDSLFSEVEPLIQQRGINLSDFLEVLSREHEIQTDGDWILIRPKDPIGCEESRLQREALGSFVRAAWSDGGVSFRNYCRFRYDARQQDIDPRIHDRYAHYLFLLTRGAVTEGIVPYPPVAYFFGSFSDAEWPVLTRDGATVRLANLTPEQQSFVLEFTGFVARACTLEGEPVVPEAWMTSSECLPRGLLAESILTVSRRTETRIRRATWPYSADEDRFLTTAQTPEQVGWILRSMAQTSGRAFEPSGVLNGEYEVGAVEVLTFSFRLREGVKYEVTAELGFRPVSGPYRYNELPLEIRRAIERGD
ncbi:MAG: hypothetical protein D6724_05490 [Armatimonadetes bacterium]|nr:MAG: hypothetical protein D6724_05490 [Armatimonadota bacterium]GIV03523.1 MAG: hypothetical protein KatS3mg015_2353 [Fimbriimonadales bacterium]